MRLARWRQNLNRQYLAGEFSMLYGDSVRQGSIEYFLTVGAWVVEYAVLAMFIDEKEYRGGTVA